MHALGRSNGARVTAFVKLSQIVGPHSGGIHDGTRTHVERPTRVHVAHRHDGDTINSFDGGYLDAICSDAPHVDCRAYGGQRESSIISLGVEVEICGREPVGAHRGQVSARCFA